MKHFPWFLFADFLCHNGALVGVDVSKLVVESGIKKVRHESLMEISLDKKSVVELQRDIFGIRVHVGILKKALNLIFFTRVQQNGAMEMQNLWGKMRSKKENIYFSVMAVYVIHPASNKLFERTVRRFISATLKTLPKA